MPQRKTISRAKRQQDMLRELAAEEAAGVTCGPGYTRAAEAIEAMRRIREGTYGFCADCEKKIPSARLLAKPEATRCIACQSDYEERSAAGPGNWGNVARRSA